MGRQWGEFKNNKMMRKEKSKARGRQEGGGRGQGGEEWAWNLFLFTIGRHSGILYKPWYQPVQMAQ